MNREMTASSDAMAQADAAWLQTIEQAASSIRRNAQQQPIVLLSGPSGSGKTTTAFLIERFLDRWGVETHTISMDHFFCSLTPQQRELAAAGKLDLESPARVDAPYLNTLLRQIAEGQPTWLPHYDFRTTTRCDKWRLLTRKAGGTADSGRASTPESGGGHSAGRDDRTALCQRPHPCGGRGNGTPPLTAPAAPPDAAGQEFPAPKRGGNSRYV